MSQELDRKQKTVCTIAGFFCDNLCQYSGPPIKAPIRVPITAHQGPSRPPWASAWSVTFRSGPDQYFSFSFFVGSNLLIRFSLAYSCFAENIIIQSLYRNTGWWPYVLKRDDKHIIYSPLCSGNLLTCCWKLPLNKYFNNCFTWKKPKLKDGYVLGSLDTRLLHCRFHS